MEGVTLDVTGEGAGADFGAFFAEHHRELGRLAYRKCGQGDVAEEIVADAFAEVWRRWDELSGAEVPAAALYEVTARIAAERVAASRRIRGGGEQREPQDPYEPDTERIQALLIERIALTPPQRAATEILDADDGPRGDGGRRGADGSRRLRRPGPIGIVIGANAIAAIVAVAVAMWTSGSPAQETNRAVVSLAESNSAASSVESSAEASASSLPSSAAATTSSLTPSHTPSASPTSPSPSVEQTTEPALVPATTVATSAVATSASPAAPTGGARTTAPSSTKLVSANAAVNSGSNSSWSQLDVATSVNQTLSSLTITVNVAACPDLRAAANWNSGASGEFTETTRDHSDGSITYEFELAPGNEVSPGEVAFAVQFSHEAGAWTASADTYSVTAEAAGSGASENVGGGF
jgi:Sigma-70 region 2